MDPRWMIAFCLALNIGSAASAQQRPNRIDLDVGEAIALPQESASPAAFSGIAFRPVDVACPEEHGTIEIRSGQMYLSRINSRGPLPGTASARLFHNKPLDDETYQYEIGNEECRLALKVRLQMQRDGGWQSAILPYWTRPSIPKEERSDLARAMMNFMKQPGSQPRPALPPGQQKLGASAIGEGFFFEAPKVALADCFQAVGSYDINGDGVFFTFLRGLPGNVNRFAIERNDINGFQGRLYFVRGACRLQVTASGSRKYNSEWAPLMIDNPI